MIKRTWSGSCSLCTSCRLHISPAGQWIYSSHEYKESTAAFETSKPFTALASYTDPPFEFCVKHSRLSNRINPSVPLQEAVDGSVQHAGLAIEKQTEYYCLQPKVFQLQQIDTLSSDREHKHFTVCYFPALVWQSGSNVEVCKNRFALRRLRDVVVG